MKDVIGWSYPHSDLLRGIEPSPDELQVTEEHNDTEEGEVTRHPNDCRHHREIIQEVSVARGKNITGW